MKTRTGFVSNSSSSSFIIGVGLVLKDKEDSVRAIIGKETYGSKIIPLTDIIGGEHDVGRWGGDGFHTKRAGGTYVVESFQESEVCVSNIYDIYEKNPDASLLVLDGGGGDDSDFWDGDEYDYDIDLDFFEEEELVVYSTILDENLVLGGDVHYGAGRNG